MEIEKCISELESELAMLDELIISHSDLIKKVKISQPDRIEMSTIAALLHSFYNGIENIFTRISNRIDNKNYKSDFWHQEMLSHMTEATKKRVPVISSSLSEKLKLYLGFRHFFRHAYAFQFRWEKMKDLIIELEEVYDNFKKEINMFTHKMKDR